MPKKLTVFGLFFRELARYFAPNCPIWLNPILRLVSVFGEK